MPKLDQRDLAGKSAPTTNVPSKGRNIVTVIGIDAYEHWPQLKNAVSDALGALKLFTEKLGFTSPVESLFDQDATRQAIEALVQDRLAAELQDDDSLVLFFAGHGHTQMSKVGLKRIETGYLVPVQARRDRYSDYLKIDSLLEDVSKLAAKHVLVILDACHAGFAVGSAMKIYRSAVRYEADLGGRVSRKVITSARRDQPALDSGPVAGHSLFTGTMIDGFNWGAADMDGNNFVTSSELGLYLQQRVGQSSKSQQTPDFGSFQFDDRGELVISLGRGNFDALKTRAFSAYQQGHFEEFRQLLAEVKLQRGDSPEAIYLGYRLSLLEGRVGDALAAVQELISRKLSAGVIPLTGRDLMTLAIQLRYWGPVLALPATRSPVSLSVRAGKDNDRLATITALPTTDGDMYDVENGSILRFCATNLSADLAHLYYIVVSPHGRLLIGPLLEADDHRIDGLPPAAEGLGPALRIRDPGSLTETRVLYSPTRISRLLFPGTTATRPLDQLDTEEVGGLRMQRLWYKVVETVDGEVEDAQDWFGKDEDNVTAAAPSDSLDDAE